jgi:hypothetical protein
VDRKVFLAFSLSFYSLILSEFLFIIGLFRKLISKPVLMNGASYVFQGLQTKIDH